MELKNFWKSLITSLLLIQSLQILDCKYALICFYCPLNLKKINRSTCELLRFSKVRKKKIKKKNTKKLDKLWRHVSPWWLSGFSWNLEWNVSYPEGRSTEKTCAVTFWHYWVTDAWKPHSIGSCIIYICLLRARTGCTWSHDPFSCILIILWYTYDVHWCFWC